MPDINSYALGLELQLQTKSAFESLTQLEQTLAAIEQRMATITPPTAVAVQLERNAEAAGLNALRNQELSEATNKLQQIQEGMNQLLVEMSQSSGVLNTSFEKQHKELQKLRTEYDDIYKVISFLGDKETEMNEIQKKQFKIAAEQLIQIKKANAALDDGLKKYHDQTKAVDALDSVLKIFGIGVGRVRALISLYKEGFTELGLILGFLGKGFKDIIEMQDAYAKTTFRALGTQGALIDQTNALRGTLGATTKQGMETITALAAAGFKAADSINELAEANQMFAHSTGVSTGETATYQRRLIVMGSSASEATRTLGAMSAAIRTSGLTAAEASGLMNLLNKSMMRMNFAFGSKQAKAMNEELIKAGAAAKAAGGDQAAFSQALSEVSSDGIKLQVLMGKLGIQYDESADQAANFNRMLREAPAATDRLRRDIGDMATTSVFTSMGLESLGMNFDLIGKAAGRSAKDVSNYMNNMTGGADLTEDFNKAISTFKETLQRIAVPILNIANTIMSIFGPALTMLLKPIELLSRALGSFVAAIDKIPGVSLLFKAAMLSMMAPFAMKGINSVIGMTKSLSGFITTARGGVPIIKNFTSVLATHAAGTKGLAIDVMNMAKSLIFGKSAMNGAAKAASAAAVETGFLARMFPSLSASAGQAGAGLAGMGGGAMQAAMGLARAHPIAAAVVAVLAGAFLIVPKLFEMFNSGSVATSALAAALMGLFAPLASVYVTLRSMWAVVKGVWEAVSELAEEAFKPLADAFKIFNGPSGKTVSLMDIMNKAMTKLTSATKIFVKAFTPVVMLFKLLGGMVQFVVSGIKAAIEKFAPVAKFAEWAINKIQDFLGINEEAEEATQQTAQAARTAYEEMWGTAEQRAAAAMQNQLLNAQDRLAETKKLITPEIIKTIQPTFTPQARPAEPVISPIAAEKSRALQTKMVETQADLLMATTQMKEAIEKMTGKIDDRTVLAAIEKILKDNLPRIAEGAEKGGLSTAANQWL